MWYALSWVLVALGLALWSLTAWAVHAASVWAVSNAGALAEPAATATRIDLPAWMAPWLPPQAMEALESLGAEVAPRLEGLLGMAPALAGGLSVAIGVVWALGCVVLLIGGAVLHALLAMLRRRSRGAQAQLA